MHPTIQKSTKKLIKQKSLHPTNNTTAIQH